MDLFELAKIITIRMDGDTEDFLDYVTILRKWMDKNYTLSQELLKGFNVSEGLALSDDRFKSLRTQIWEKPVHNKNRKYKEKWKEKLEQIRQQDNQIHNEEGESDDSDDSGITS